MLLHLTAVISGQLLNHHTSGSDPHRPPPTQAYTEGDGERAEVGGQQAEDQAQVADEAVHHAAVPGVPHEGAAVRGAQVHDQVTLGLIGSHTHRIVC